MDNFTRPLPNSTGVLVLGILSIVLSCCCSGIIGLILAIIALVMAGKAKRLYMASPESYTGYSNLKTGRVMAVIGIVLSVIFLLISIYFWVIYGTEGVMMMQEEWLREMGIDM